MQRNIIVWIGVFGGKQYQSFGHQGRDCFWRGHAPILKHHASLKHTISSQSSDRVQISRPHCFPRLWAKDVNRQRAPYKSLVPVHHRRRRLSIRAFWRRKIAQDHGGGSGTGTRGDLATMAKSDVELALTLGVGRRRNPFVGEPPDHRRWDATKRT